MGREHLAAAGSRAWMVWLQTIVGAVVANLVLRAVALAIFDIPAEFEPLATAVPTIFLTVVGVGGGLVVAIAVDGLSERPVALFQRIVIVALVLSMLPDLYMFTASGAAAFPGANVPAVITLMLQHVAAAAVVLWRAAPAANATA